MRKWILLAVITLALLVFGYLNTSAFVLGQTYYIILAFFSIQTIVLFRVDQLAPVQWKVQVSLVKIVLRLLTALIFFTVLLYTSESPINTVIQFIVIYLIFMIFEIVEALTNLRRN